MAKGKILVVDDESVTREILADILTDEGYSASIAKDGYEAIEKVESGEHFDLFILDIKLPGINGVETLRAIKKINPQVKTILMTAYSLENLVKEGLELGAYTCLYKPLEISELLKIIEKNIV